MNSSFGPKRVRSADDYAGDCWNLCGVNPADLARAFPPKADSAAVDNDAKVDAMFFDASFGE